MIDPDLARSFAALPPVRRILDALRRPGAHRAVGGLWGASAGLLLAAIRAELNDAMLIVTADDEDSRLLAGDLAAFGAEGTLVLVTQHVDADGEADPTTRGARARCLAETAAAADFVLAASLPALLQPVPDVVGLRRGRVTFERGEHRDQAGLIAACAEAGLRRVPVVLAPGEFSSRGDVVDLLPLAATEAVRLEFFDGVLESIRTFDPATQRSIAPHEAITIVLGAAGAGGRGGDTGLVLEHVFRPDLLVVFYEPLRIDECRQRLIGFDRTRQTAVGGLTDTLAPLRWLEVSSLPSQDLDLKVLSAGSATGSGEADPLGRLRSIRGVRGAVRIVCRTGAERDRLEEIFTHKRVDLPAERVELAVGALSRGFRVPDLGLAVVSNVEFAGTPAPARVVERPVLPSRAVQSFFELGPGDVVVHAVHGLARFEGIERIERGESVEDHLQLYFQDDVKLLVPVSKIHLVQKYVGAGEAAPKLDKLGGRGFARRKEEVQRALFDIAADLLEVQARRQRSRREPYPADELEAEFLDAFPFEDTPDQATAWREIRADLEKPHPMDRLLCGDVGFGKTELAMRTAFRVAIAGRQVAVLAPTTLLSDQHGETFRGRFGPHGLRVEVLTRFRTGKDKTALLADVASGRVDVLIGTHRILSDDVAFHDLGLAVVDEEQRFGVRQKEHLKRLRTAVDVLTLSATPIPRTLHGGLLGIRDISTLGTPPAGRLDVETHVAYRDDRLLAEALRRELERGGQVFVLHNRIEGLEPLRALCEQLVPGIKVTIGHGRMTAARMEKAVRGFVRGAFDVLVCTTIVENGLDIARANTMLIDRAELFGLAELHQLRGRVGRSSEQAYCYLLMDRANPPPPDARRRLKALEEFAHLGAGFAIAMKDLEIRGAGNLLGPQQSGHIAAVGYDMYARLLRVAVERARDEGPASSAVTEVDVDLQLRAFLPDEFAPEPKERLELLREMDRAVDPAAAADVRADLIDRFGSLPPPVENLLRVFLLKHLLAAHGVLAVQRTGADRVVVRHPRGHPLGGAWLDAFADTRPVEAGKTHLILPIRGRAAGGRGTGGWTGEQTLQHLLDALCDTAPLPKIGAWHTSEHARRSRSGSR